MTVHFFGSPKKTTVKIKQIRFFKNRKKHNKEVFSKNDRPFFRKPQKNDSQNQKSKIF
jgi:hypothetical protein